MKVTLAIIAMLLTSTLCTKSEDRMIQAHLAELAQMDSTFKSDSSSFNKICGGGAGDTSSTITDNDVYTNTNGHVVTDHVHTDGVHAPVHTHHEYVAHVGAGAAAAGCAGGADAEVAAIEHEAEVEVHEPVVHVIHGGSSHSEAHVINESSTTVNGHTEHDVDTDDTIDGHHTHHHHHDHTPVVITAVDTDAGC